MASYLVQKELLSLIRHYVELRLKLVRQLHAINQKLMYDHKSTEVYDILILVYDFLL